MKIAVYKRYMLALLLIILAFNGVDGLALGLVLQNIKMDLHLSDTELGLLSGIAFALFYSFMGIPISRWADRGNRVVIIALTTALWSVMVSLCGLAGSFEQLLIMRIGVAVGEPGCIPPAHSLIADYFSRAERPWAISVYMQGGSLSVLIGYFMAGWLNEHYGWRQMFMMLGMPGLGLAAFAWFTLREPRRAKRLMIDGNSPVGTFRVAGAKNGLTPTPPSLKEVCVTLWRKRTFLHLVLCFAVASFFSFGILQWQPAFFIRSYGLKTGELGTWFALIYGLGGAIGTYLGGAWASRRAANNERLQLRAMAVSYAGFGVISALVYLASNRYLAFALMGLTAVGGALTAGPLFATIQSLVPPTMRATAIAIIYLFANLVGLGLGPLAVGALSDILRPLLGEESLRYALLSLCPGYFWAAWHLLRASKSVTRDINAARAHLSAEVEDDALVGDGPDAQRIRGVV
jgi:MFS family permease